MLELIITISKSCVKYTRRNNFIKKKETTMLLREKYNQAVNEYTAMTPEASKRFLEAKKTLPGGETRSAAYMYPYPLFIEKANGTKLIDLDGNEYTDFINNYTSMLHGHANATIEARIIDALRKGTGVTAVLPEQVELSKVLCDRIPGIDQLRFCNSGTEATMFAVRTARLVQNRDKIIKIEGGYHGTSDCLEYNILTPKTDDGSAFHTEPVPACGGIPGVVGESLIFAPFNDLNIIENILKKQANEIAAVIVEPLLGLAGFVAPKPGYLKGLRELTEKFGVLLIFDEVQSFRLSRGGVQEIEGITPDLTAVAKIIGGGLPVGAFGGKEEIMKVFTGGLEAKLSHSGTFNGCRPVMAAGLAAMELYEVEAILKLNQLGDRLADGINKCIAKHALPISVTHWGSLLHIHFVENAPTNYQEAIPTNKLINSLFHLEMVKRGLYIAPRGSWALSTPMDQKDIDFAIKTVDECFHEIKPYF
jgi:glutamate-1-semialdehyde 2,1-aminomutase